MTDHKLQIHTLDSVKTAAQQFQTRNAFALGNSGAYFWAQRNGLLDAVCSHMVAKRGGRA